MAAMTMTALSLILAGVGTATSVAGQFKAGKANRAAGVAADAAARAGGLAEQRSLESQAGLADYNAQVADLQSADATARGVQDENKFRTGVRGMIGSQRASLAASNVDVSFGSAADVQGDAAFLGELDALTIRTNAAREAWGFNVQGEDLRRRAQTARQEGAYAAESGVVTGAAQRAAGESAYSAAKWGIASTLVGAGGSLLAQKYGFGGGKSKPAPKSFDANMLYAGRF